VVEPHVVPGAYKAHDGAPLQTPVRPHEFAPSSGHSLSGSVPAATLSHTPSEPPPFFAALHAWHVPVHGESQQYPSTQLLLEHWRVREHTAPFVCAATHLLVPASQK
jgi:hypothetical protein